VIHATPVDVLSCDSPREVDALRYGALAGACPRGRNVEGGDGAELTAYEAVITPLASMSFPVVAPRSLMLEPSVPCPEPVPAPVTFYSLMVPFAART
jgi:hypothetical protein